MLCFIINLKYRLERKKNVLREFAGRDEFTVTVVEAIRHEIGAIGLWQTIKYILQSIVSEKEEFVILCEDDHQFTKDYSKELLKESIAEAKRLDADILLGGISWFQNAFEASRNIFWAEVFSGTQFTIIFRKFFNQIIDSAFEAMDSADYKICSLTNKTFFIYPFISIQKDYGYSDATLKNNKEAGVQDLFDNTIERLRLLDNVSNFYANKKQSVRNISTISLENIAIPTYIINLPERRERRAYIESQFKGRNEFDVTITDAVKHKVGAVGLWLSIRKIITTAIENDDDVIIICEDDHEFTPEYSKEFLIRNILEAHQQGCDYLNGGSGKFDLAIPITKNRYWTNHCLSTQFIMLYRKFFQQILDEPFNESIVADMQLSGMTSNKMLLYPYVSTQKDFGYSDITALHNEQEGLVTNMFNSSKRRLKNIQKAYLQFGREFSNKGSVKNVQDLY